MYTAALDIGGTKTIAAIVDETGKILTMKKFPTNVADSQAHLEYCAQVMETLFRQMDVDPARMPGLGVSLPGIVDYEQGALIYAPYAKWENVPVAAYLKERLKVKTVCCENDVNACAVGELKFGLGKQYTDFVWMTVSTGVGGAVVMDSKLVRGAQGFAGELGHLKVEYDHPVQCSCGQFGCMEAQASGTALNRMVREHAQKSEEFARALSGLPMDGAGCAALAESGNEEARQIFRELGSYLGRGISYCANILNPQAVIIGGGVSASLDWMQPGIQTAIQTNTFPKLQDFVVTRTPLGYEAALLGAAALTL